MNLPKIVLVPYFSSNSISVWLIFIFGLLDRYFWSYICNEAPSVELKQPHCFLLFFFFCKIEHSLGKGLKFCSLPFLIHIPFFNHCFLATNTTSGSCFLKLSLLDCSLLTLPVSTKLGPIDDFANFSSKF